MRRTCGQMNHVTRTQFLRGATHNVRALDDTAGHEHCVAIQYEHHLGGVFVQLRVAAAEPDGKLGAVSRILLYCFACAPIAEACQLAEIGSTFQQHDARPVIVRWRTFGLAGRRALGSIAPCRQQSFEHLVLLSRGIAHFEQNFLCGHKK